MALKVESLKESPTGKRVEAVVLKTSFWSNDERYQIRIVSKKEIESVTDLLKEVIDRKGDWQEGKKNRFLILPELKVTAYILKEEIIEA